MIALATPLHDKKGNTTKTQIVDSKLGLGFWNRTLAVILLYGGLSTLAVVELDHASGIFPFLSLFDNQGLGVVILAFGTLGMSVVRDRVLEPGQWIPARRFAVGLAGSLAVASAATEDMTLVLVCLMVMIMHIVLPELIED
jgi:hypothetical protein